MIDYILGGLIILAVILSIRKIRRDRKNGSCCGGCSGCSQAKGCSSFTPTEKNPDEK